MGGGCGGRFQFRATARLLVERSVDPSLGRDVPEDFRKAKGRTVLFVDKVC